MPDPKAAPAADGPVPLSDHLARDLATLDTELAEIDLLITQARTEAGRHEGRRSAATDKLTALGAEGDPTTRLDLATSLVALTRRAALMEAQVDVLEGKRRTLARYRDAVAGYAEAVAGGRGGTGPGPVGPADVDPDAPLPPAVSRMLATAQEDLRREIARAMHDGPAQSLTNIVLQAQIVERLVGKDPVMAEGEIRQLVAMVQHTLDATKSFIFDVRPMVLDDLGLVPTIRRGTRDRGRRAGIPVTFESVGQDRRLPMDLESALFRMLDEAIAGYLAGGPDEVAVQLDWGDELRAQVSAKRGVIQTAATVADTGGAVDEASLPPALAAMVEERRVDAAEKAEAARRSAIVTLPAAAWREIQGRAASVGATVELLADGGEVRITAPIPPIESAGPSTPPAAAPAT